MAASNPRGMHVSYVFDSRSPEPTEVALHSSEIKALRRAMAIGGRTVFVHDGEELVEAITTASEKATGRSNYRSNYRTVTEPKIGGEGHPLPDDEPLPVYSAGYDDNGEALREPITSEPPSTGAVQLPPGEPTAEETGAKIEKITRSGRKASS